MKLLFLDFRQSGKLFYIFLMKVLKPWTPIDGWSPFTIALSGNRIIDRRCICCTGWFFPFSKIDFVFDISYDTDISKAKGVLYRTARENPHVLPEPSPYAAVKEHGSNSVRLTCQVWCRSDDYWNAYYTMQEDVKNAFDKNAGASVAVKILSGRFLQTMPRIFCRKSSYSEHSGFFIWPKSCSCTKHFSKEKIYF